MLYTYHKRWKSNFRRFLLMLFTTLLILLIPTTVLRSQHHTRPDYQLLWRIDGPGLSSPSYLFGTMHLTDKRVFEFSDSVLIALRSANSFAMEIDMDSLMSYIFSPEGIMSDTVNYMRGVLTAKEYHYVDSMVIKKTGTSIDQLKVKRLWILENLLLDEEEALSRKAGHNLKAENIFLDGWLHQKATLLNKPIHSLEKMQNQLHLVGTNVSETQKDMFLENLGYYESEANETKPGTIFKERISYLDSLVNMYYDANLQKIAALTLGSDIIYGGPGLSVRNVEMADNLAALITKGSVFAAVGAAHLPGEKGIISLLRAKGFTISAVKATFTGLAKKDRQQLDSTQGYMLNKIAEGYSVALPGVPISYPIPNSNRKMYIGTSGAQAGFAFCTDVPQLGTGVQHLLKTMVDNMSRQGNGILQKSYPITYRDIEGMEAIILQNNIPFYVRVFFRNHRIFAFMYGTQDNDSTARKDFFRSVRFYDIVRPAITYDTLSRPQLGFSAILPSDVSHMDNMAAIRPTEVYSSIDDVNGISYILRIDKMGGGYFNNSDRSLLKGIRGILIKEDSTVHLIDSTVSKRDGLPLYQLIFRHNNGYISRLHFIPRGNIAYTLLSVYDSTRTNSPLWQRFLNGFHSLPLQSQSLTTRFTPADSSFSIMGPTTFKPINTDDQQESSVVNIRSYAAVDTMSYTTYATEIYRYNPYYYNEPDSLVETLIHPADSLFIITSQQKTMSQDQITYTVELKLRGTGLLCYRKIVITGHTIYHLLATMPGELASKGYGQQFLNTFRPGPGYQTDTLRLQQKKLATLLKDLQSSDTTVFNKANNYLRNIRPDSTDKELIVNTLAKSFPADTVKRNVKLRLLLSLMPVADNDVVAAAGRLFSETKDTSQRIRILRFLAGLSLDSAIHTFLLLAPEIPENEASAQSIFPYDFNEDSLYQRFIPEMISTAERSRSFLQAFTNYTSCWDSIWHLQQLPQYGLNRLLPAINQLFEYQLNERRKCSSNDIDLWTWEGRLLSTGRILIQPGIQAPATTIAIFKQLLTDSLISLRSLGAWGLFNNGIPVDDKIISSILADPETGYTFISKMDDTKLLPRIRHLLSQEIVGGSYLSSYFSEDYAISALEQVSRVKVKYGKEPEQWLILYRFKTGESEDWEYAFNGPHPLNNKELNLFPTLIHIVSDEVRKDKKLLAEEALKAYKNFLEPEESEETAESN